MANRLEIPFTKGIQAAGNRNASSEPGKLDLAYNVHVRPEQAEVLYRRPGVTTVGTRSKMTRVGRLDGRIALAQQNTVQIQNSTGAMQEALPYGLLSEISSTGLATSENEAILCCGYAEDSTGNAIAVTAHVPLGGTSTSVFYAIQLKNNGVWGFRQSANFSGLLSAAGTRRFCIFESQADSTRWVLFHSEGNNFQRMEILKSTGGTFAPATVIANAILWDIVPYSTGWRVLYQSTATNRLIVADVSTAYATTTSVTVTAAGPISPTAAGLVYLGGTDLHVWHGGYAADSNTLYMHSIAWPAAAVSRLTLASVLDDGSSNNAIVAMSVGGGPAVRNRAGSATEVASYCYIVGGAGNTQKFGRIFRATVASVEAGRTFTGAIYPQARLWTGADFFGARVFGVYGTIMGVWQMTNGASGNYGDTTIPMVYHSVTLGETPTYDLVPRSNSMWVSSDGNEAKAILWNRSASQIDLVHCGWADTTGQIVESNGFQVMLGGVPRYWDGTYFRSLGIPTAPRVLTATPTATGTMAAGTYIYGFCWSFVDSVGRRMRSPATLVTVVVPASGRVDFDMDPASRFVDSMGYYGGLAGPNVAELEIYRSDPNGTQVRKITAYVSRTRMTLYSDSGNTVTQDTGSATFGGEVLYTTGAGASELPSTAFESTTVMRGYSDRALWSGPLFPEVVSYTKTLRQGRVLEANQALTLIVPQPVTGLAYQDGNVYAFSADNCWAFAPQFADDTGNGTPSVDPVPLSTGIGCTQPRSIVETPGGVFFIGPRGYYMIARGGGPPQFVGADVEPYFIDYPTCQGVAHNTKTHEVAWVMSNGSDHRVIVLNYQAAQWFAWRIGDTGTAQATELTTLGGGVTCLSTGFVFGERGTANAAAYVCSDTQLTDVGSLATAQIPVEIRSRDIQPDGIGSICRVRSIVADVEGGASSVLRISESHDGGTTWSTEYSLATDDGNQPPVYQFAVQRTRGVRFRLRTITGDVPPLSLSGVSLSYSSGQRVHTSSSRRRG